MLKLALDTLIDFLYPKSAQIYELEAITPDELLKKLSPAQDPGDNIIALWSYPDPRVRELVWELKYRRNAKIAESLAAVLYDVLQAELAERALFENFTKPILIPMPMSGPRLRERGWNQTEVLSEALVKLGSVDLFEYVPKALAREHTESQTKTQNKKERLRNVEGSMRTTGEVRGRNIILLDDVTTTGATFRDARRALRESGAKKILCVALAH